jgi:beta-1,4-mannosyltransferase
LLPLPIAVANSRRFDSDEDFSVLLEALCELEGINYQTYQRDANKKVADIPRIVVIITGKGPDRAKYEAIIAKLPFQRIRVVTGYLTNEDYPQLLGSCDLGVSLHKSSSGLDLPMKVVDMFGSGLPVCAVNFKW